MRSLKARFMLKSLQLLNNKYFTKDLKFKFIPADGDAIGYYELAILNKSNDEIISIIDYDTINYIYSLFKSNKPWRSILIDAINRKIHL